MRVEIVTVGDELLLGDTVNGNAAWLGQQLAAAGIQVTRGVVVGDEMDVIIGAVTEGLSRADAVITTGGLGPTSDDLTRDALAQAAGVRLVRDPVLEKRLRDRVAAAGRTLQPMALRMAEVPEGATLLRNPVGGAPGLRVELPGAEGPSGAVYALPGVPHEMRAITTEELLPRLIGARSGHAPAMHTLRTVGVWESDVAARLAQVEALDHIKLAYLPDAGEVKVRITATGPDAEARLREAEAVTRDLLGDAVYGGGADTLDRAVHRLLAERSATVATAESLTGGMIGAAFTDMPGSSATYAGGVVAYDTRLKAELLGVPEELLKEHGAVHPDVAAAMAAGVRDRLGASYGLAVTGVAGPDPQDGRPVGTVYVSVAGPGNLAGSGGAPIVAAPRLPVPGDPRRARPTIRRMTVVHALDLLRRAILGLDSGFDDGLGRGDREGIG